MGYTLNHTCLVTHDLTASMHFYVEVLGIAPHLYVHHPYLQDSKLSDRVPRLPTTSTKLDGNVRDSGGDARRHEKQSQASLNSSHSLTPLLHQHRLLLMLLACSAILV